MGSSINNREPCAVVVKTISFQKLSLFCKYWGKISLNVAETNLWLENFISLFFVLLPGEQRLELDSREVCVCQLNWNKTLDLMQPVVKVEETVKSKKSSSFSNFEVAKSKRLLEKNLYSFYTLFNSITISIHL